MSCPPDARSDGRAARSLGWAALSVLSSCTTAGPSMPPAPTDWRTLTTSLLLISVPVVLGGLTGVLLRRFLGRRLTTGASAVACLLLPVVVTLIVCLRGAVIGIGIWDLVLEASFFGVGVLATSHRALSGRRQRMLSAGGLLAGLLLLEVGSRLLLPAPPSFPIEGGPHLWLSDALKADSNTLPWDARSKEIACHVVYGDAYRGLLEVQRDPRMSLPELYSAPETASRPVLHLGDSMVFGFGVRPEETFVAALAQAEPQVTHINAGIPGLAPDAYLAVLQAWSQRIRPALTVMYLFEGNDVHDLDSPFPCCGWQPLLKYDGDRASLRCSKPTSVDPARAGSTWLRYNSPPPFLVRAMVGHSKAAAFIGAALAGAGGANSLTSDETQELRLQHLVAIARTARDELRAQAVPLLVVVLPTRAWVETGEADHPAPELVRMLSAAGVAVVDASPVVLDAAARGERLFLGDQNDCHFNPAGHNLMARWLHDQISARLASAP